MYEELKEFLTERIESLKNVDTKGLVRADSFRKGRITAYEDILLKIVEIDEKYI